jgi:type I restriction enzyme S subunit
MSSEWRTARLVDIAAKERWALNGGPFGSKLSRKHYSESGVPVIRGTNLPAGSKFSFDDFVYVSEEKADELRANNAHRGDLIFTQRGTIGQVGLIPLDSPIPRFVISQSQMKLTVDPEQADAQFLYYFFSAADTVQKIQNLAFAAGVPHINLDILRKFETPVPPLAVQRRIAGILSAYDELIENSQRRIRILETMARNLYREWFVHFRFPGHDSLPKVPSPLGPIPQGWEVKPLGDIAEDMRRNVPKGELEEPKPYVGLEHIPRRSLALDAWETATELGSNKLEFKKGEVLFGKIRPYFHKVSVAPFDGLCSADTIVIRARRPEHYAVVVACVSSDAFVAEASATANGAKMPRANWSVLERFPVVIPKGGVAKRFSELFAEFIEQQQVLIFQSQNLRRTRDLLLPRLLSGQVSDQMFDP